MAMTRYEHSARDYLSDTLAKQGYNTYALLLQKLDFHFTENPNIIGYLNTTDASITLNRNLYTNQLSTIIRHEILHEVLKHAARQLAIIQKGGKFVKIPHDIFNIAADFEISNLGYTDDDKRITRNIILNGKTLKGLVTEDHFPDWTELSFEEMLEKLIDRQEQIESLLQQQLEKRTNAQPGEIEELEDLIRRLEGALEKAEAEANENQKTAEQADSSEAAEKAEEQADSAFDSASVIKRLTQKAEKLKKSLEKLGKSTELTPEEKKKEEAEVAERVATFKKILEYPSLSNMLKDETTQINVRNRVAYRDKELAAYRKSPIAQFEMSLIKFIKKAVAEKRDSTWSRLNLTYQDKVILRPGRKRIINKKVPVINVYFDRSGSFSNYPNKTKAAESVISLLDKYVRQGKLKVNLYYATNTVYEDRAEAERVGMGMDAPPVIKHIQQTKPDNVIIMTDSDSEASGNNSVTVPGGVWILFFQSTSNLHKYIKGTLETQIYEVN